jgi:hypothetical protein
MQLPLPKNAAPITIHVPAPDAVRVDGDVQRLGGGRLSFESDDSAC